MLAFITIAVLLLAGYGMYADTSGCVGYKGIDETPLTATKDEETVVSDPLAREHSSVMEDERDDAALDPDID